MAENGPLTPEKQLLRLIEDSKASKQESSQAPAKLKGPGLLSFSALRGALFGRISFLKRTTKKKIGGAKFSVNIVAINRVLTVVAVCLLAYAVFDAIASAMALHHPPNFVYRGEKSPSPAILGVSPLKESAYYLQKVTARDIFKEGAKPAEHVQDKKDEKPSIQDNEAVKSLSLVGISWSSDPDVIVEDKSKQKTYFVKRGQMVGENIKVEAVFKDHVVLSLDGQEFELR